MIEIKGSHNSAKCYTDVLEPGAYAQIQRICDDKIFYDSKIRIMPDVHAGKGCTIGTTMTISDKIVPEMVGVDIGCGMETIRIAEKDIDFEKLDTIIRENIPCGNKIRNQAHEFNSKIDLEKLRCASRVDLNRAALSIGTLGAGNHFIELDRDNMNNIYIVIHSGSRHLGCEVAKYYQDQGKLSLQECAKFQRREIIENLKNEGKSKEIQSVLDSLKDKKGTPLSEEFLYINNQLFDDYIYDMKIMSDFALLNRKAMAQIIIDGMCFTEEERFSTVHNYIDTEKMILRKGAVSAEKGEKLLIPMNMRDGSLICIGKGNEDWNCSAPHGAGRLMSRSTAFQRLSMEDYKEQMKDIYSTCIIPGTLDESPMAYKSMEEIVFHIMPTVEIERRIVPIYNFKSSK